MEFLYIPSMIAFVTFLYYLNKFRDQKIEWGDAGLKSFIKCLIYGSISLVIELILFAFALCIAYFHKENDHIVIFLIIMYSIWKIFDLKESWSNNNLIKSLVLIVIELPVFIVLFLLARGLSNLFYSK